MKTLIAIITLTIATSAQASQWNTNNIELFWALSDAGASYEQAMGKTYVGIENLSCFQDEDVYVCEMTDMGVRGQGQKLVVTGEKAEAILDALSDLNGFNPFNANGAVSNSITCFVRPNELIDIDNGEQAYCTVTEQ